MKKVKNFSMLMLLLLAVIFISTSCKKKGCTDNDATNFCPKCGDNNGSCTYKGRIVFWYNHANAQFLVNDGAISLTYYINGAIVGSSAASVYWNSAPDCGQSVTVEKDLGKNKTVSYSYSVKDQTGFEYYSGSVTFYANTCTAYELQ